MKLELQFITILYSFLFGMFYMLSYFFSYKILYHKNIYIKISSTIIFCFSNVYIYYLVLEKINDGILHPYGIITTILGMILSFVLFTKMKN